MGIGLGIAGMGTGVCMLHPLWELEWEDVFSRREREREYSVKTFIVISPGWFSGSPARPTVVCDVS